MHLNHLWTSDFNLAVNLRRLIQGTGDKRRLPNRQSIRAWNNYRAITPLLSKCRIEVNHKQVWLTRPLRPLYYYAFIWVAAPINFPTAARLQGGFDRCIIFWGWQLVATLPLPWFVALFQVISTLADSTRKWQYTVTRKNENLSTIYLADEIIWLCACGRPASILNDDLFFTRSLISPNMRRFPSKNSLWKRDEILT